MKKLTLKKLQNNATRTQGGEYGPIINLNFYSESANIGTYTDGTGSHHVSEFLFDIMYDCGYSEEIGRVDEIRKATSEAKTLKEFIELFNKAI